MKGKSMHRKKFLSFLGMAVVAAPILAKEIRQTKPQVKEPKVLELKGAVEPTQTQGFKVDGPYPSEGQFLTYNSTYNSLGWEDPFFTNGNILVGSGGGNELGWEWNDPFEGFGTYQETYTSDIDGLISEIAVNSKSPVKVLSSSGWVNFKVTPYE
jgi:hypothetical protein